MSDASIDIEVIYALPHKAEIVRLRLPLGSSLQQALEASGLLQKHAEIDLVKGRFGVFGKLCQVETSLHDGDRVEVYRPLIADPKEVRRKRADEGKAMKKGGGLAQA